MDLSKVLIDSMTSIDSLSALTSRSKATPTQVKNTIMSAVPGLLGAMEANTATEEGARDLLGALSQHTNSGSMRSQLAGADLVDGDKILSKILGEYKTDFLSQVSTYHDYGGNHAEYLTSYSGDNMIHSLLFPTQSNYLSSGYMSSLGCIRITRENAAFVYYNCPGSTFIIR